MKTDLNKVLIIAGASIICLFILIFVIVATFWPNKKENVNTTDVNSVEVAGTVNPNVPTQAVRKGSIWKSEDGGASFVPQLLAAGNAPETADILTFTFHPTVPGFVILGTAANGLFKTENGGSTWASIVFPPKNIYSFILDKNRPDNRMFASGVSSGYGKVFRTDDGGANWRAVYTEPGQSSLITALAQHPRTPTIIFAGTNSGTLVKSSDGGETWKNIGNVIKGSIADITFDSGRTAIMYLFSQGKLYYSADNGTSWVNWEEQKKKEVEDLKDLAADLSRNGRKAEANALKDEAAALTDRNKTDKAPSGVAVFVPDPKQSGVIYAGTSEGLFRSVSSGKYWSELNIIESAKKFTISSIAVNPNNSNEIVFVAGKAFYKTLNRGETWSVTPLESDRDASFVAYDPSNPQKIFIGLSK